MDIKFDWLDIIISAIIIGIYFVLLYSLKEKFYKRLINPVQVIKKDMKLSRYFFISITVFISSDLYYYFEHIKALNLPYTIKLFPFTFFFLHFMIIKSLKNTLKNLEESTDE